MSRVVQPNTTFRVTERPVHASPTDLSHELSIPGFLARVLSARGVRTQSDLDLRLKNLLLPSGIPDIERAAARLVRAIHDNERIVVCGDFDVDGSTASALCVDFLTQVGAEDVTFRVPDRKTFGYGFTEGFAEVVLKLHPDVIVTVDNGVSSHQGIALAKSKGVDVIVTDHHLAPDTLPQAHCIVNPNLPQSNFASAPAGVGVAFYLMSVVRTILRTEGYFGDSNIVEPRMADWLDLVALGTVVDLVPLDRNNRILVKAGLRQIQQGKARPGIYSLCSIANRDSSQLSTGDLGFAVGPRINAAGRLADISVGIQCLLAKTESEAEPLARELDEINVVRRSMQQEMTKSAEVAAATSFRHERSGLVIYDPSFHEGVVGLIAGRIKDKIGIPVAVFSGPRGDDDGIAKGSVRSVSNVNIRDVLVDIHSAHPELLLTFGGHAMAAGLTIKRANVNRFEALFCRGIERQIGGVLEPEAKISDGVLSEEELSLDSAQAIERFGPWGKGFDEPMFHGDFEVVQARAVGNGKHAKYVLRIGNTVVDAIAFGQDVVDSRRLRILYTLEINEYRGHRTLQLVIDSADGV